MNVRQPKLARLFIFMLVFPHSLLKYLFNTKDGEREEKVFHGKNIITKTMHYIKFIIILYAFILNFSCLCNAKKKLFILRNLVTKISILNSENSEKNVLIQFLLYNQQSTLV